jgi:membrane protease YdiL (CAAX protease family)
MSFSVEDTRRRLPLLYLAALPAAAIIWLLPYKQLLTDLRLWYLFPLWVVLAHLCCGFSYLVTSWSVRRGLRLVASSITVYGQRACGTHLQAAFLVAFVEEVLFRYALLSWLAGVVGSLGALLITSALFSAVHLQLRGPGRLLRQLDLLLFALLLGALVLATASLYPALLLHGMRNYILRCLLISAEEYEAIQRQGE